MNVLSQPRMLCACMCMLFVVLISPTAQAATYTISFYESNVNGAAICSNLYTGCTFVGQGTFEIADSAVSPNNLVMFGDPEFLAFDVSLSLLTGDSTTFTLGIDDFQIGTTSERGIMFDAAGNPLRFDLPTTVVSNSISMCDPVCGIGINAIARLSLIDDDNFSFVVLADGTIVLRSNVPSGSTFTPLNGSWLYAKGVNIGGAGVEVRGYYVISAVPVPATAWLFGSGLLGLIGVSRRKKAA